MATCGAVLVDLPPFLFWVVVPGLGSSFLLPVEFETVLVEETKVV